MGGEQHKIWITSLRAKRNISLSFFNNNSNRRRGGKTQGRKIFIGVGSELGYHLGGEGSDKGLSYQFKIRRRKLSRNTPKI
jgi:hypothetical protein